MAPHALGVKVTIATTLKDGLVVGMRSMPGNPWDSQTLTQTLEQVEILADAKPKMAIVDKEDHRATAEEPVRNFVCEV